MLLVPGLCHITADRCRWPSMSKMSGGPRLANIHFSDYRKTSDISRTLLGSKIVVHSDVVGASPVGAAPTTSSLST